MAGGILLTQEEKKALGEFIGNKKGEKITFGEMKKLTIELALLSPFPDGVPRNPLTFWNHVREIAQIPRRFSLKRKKKGFKSVGGAKSVGVKKSPKKTKVAVADSAVRKILEELRPIMGFMGKPVDYLRPLDNLLTENVELTKCLKVAEGKAAIGKVGSEEIKQLKKEIEKLKNFLIPAKEALRLTCDLRREAIALTQYAEDLKKKKGTDFYAFLQELNDYEPLK